MVVSVADLVQSNKLTNQSQAADNSALGKEDFLKLLLVQMQYQDPLDPIDNRAMLSQMAEFSSLEQMSNLNENFSNANSLASFMDATRLLGKEIEILDPSAPDDQPAAISSKVTSVNFSSEGPLLTLENGIVATVPEVIKVTEPATE